MANMSYCRFQNTLKDLEDCFNHMDQEDDMCATEKSARESLLNLCVEIVDNYGEEVGICVDVITPEEDI